MPYGYTRTYDPQTRKLVSQDPHLAEAPLVRELFARLRTGHSLKAIARDFTARGLTDPHRPALDGRAPAGRGHAAGLRRHARL